MDEIERRLTLTQGVNKAIAFLLCFGVVMILWSLTFEPEDKRWAALGAVLGLVTGVIAFFREIKKPAPNELGKKVGSPGLYIGITGAFLLLIRFVPELEPLVITGSGVMSFAMGVLLVVYRRRWIEAKSRLPAT